jgi:hypothetical protein
MISRSNCLRIWSDSTWFLFWETQIFHVYKTVYSPHKPVFDWCQIETMNFYLSNHNTTFAFRRFIIRLTSIFICFTKTWKTWKFVFISTFDCTLIINRWITFSTMYARFISKWRIINESMCIMFTMFHSIFTRRVSR